MIIDQFLRALRRFLAMELSYDITFEADLIPNGLIASGYTFFMQLSLVERFLNLSIGLAWVKKLNMHLNSDKIHA